MTPLRRVLAGRALPWLLFAAAAAAAAAFAVLWTQERAESDRIEELRLRARRFVLALTTFSFKTIEKDVGELRSFAVGEFEDQVDELFSPETVRAIEEAEASSTSQVEAVFVQQIGPDDATVFAVAHVAVENARSDRARTEVVRMEIGWVQTGEEWRVESVELIQSPGSPDPASLGWRQEARGPNVSISAW